MKVQDKKIKVSVCVVTYNQKNYIRQCLQSIVDQKTNFDFEVIVGDDFSTDGTREIVRQFARDYPKIFKIHLHEFNIGAYRNFLYVHKQAVGEFVAHIDGDDYIFPGKLQVQKEILDAESDCNIVWHRMKIQDMSTGLLHDDIIDVGKFKKRELRRCDLLALGTVACHSSKMYRANKSFEISGNTNVLDYYTDIIQIGDGYAVLIDELLGVYRYGIGIAVNSFKTKNLYIDHIKEFYNKYPEYSVQIAANVFWMFLVEIKNRRRNAVTLFLLWLKYYSFKSIILVMSSISLRKTLRTKVW